MANNLLSRFRQQQLEREAFLDVPRPEGEVAWRSRQQLRALYFAAEEDSSLDILAEDQGSTCRMTALSPKGVEFLGMFDTGDSEQYSPNYTQELIRKAQTCGLVLKSDL